MKKKLSEFLQQYFNLKSLVYLIYILWIPFWWLQLLIPRSKTLWIFGSWYGKEFTDNSKALYEYIITNCPEIKAIWLTRNKNLSQNQEGCIYLYSLKGFYFSIRAGVVIFSSGKFDVNPFLINGALTIQTWHGAPMKKIGFDDRINFQKTNQKLLKYFFPFLYNYNQSAVVSTAVIFNEILRSAFDTKNVLLTGYPRNDIFYKKSKSRIIEEIDKKFNNPFKIIYLPTFRDNGGAFEPFIRYSFEEEDWKNYLNQNNSVLVTYSHFASKELSNVRSNERIIQLKRKPNNDLNNLLKDMDVLITDYSGVYFDFLLLKKPIILACFDFEDYTEKCRELYFDYFDEIKGAKCNNWPSILKELEKLKFTEFDENYITKFNTYQDGDSSKRLTNEIKSILNI